MIKLQAISRNTFIETIRQPIYGVMIIVTILVLVLSLPLSHWTMATDYEAADQKMLQNLGLSTLLVSGLLIGAFSASGALSAEIEDGTALTVLSKPLTRATFVLGKFAGLTGALAVAFYICCLVFLLTIRHHVVSSASSPIDWPVIVLGLSAVVISLLVGVFGNLWFGWSFISAHVWSAVICLSIAAGVIGFVGKGWTIVPFGEGISGQLLIAIGLIFMALLILTGTAVAAGTRCGQTMTLMISITMFVVGSMHPNLFGRLADRIPIMGIFGWAAVNLTYFYQIDALTRDVTIPGDFVAKAAAYCLLYCAGLLAIGSALFQTRQLESQEVSSSLPSLSGLLAWVGRAASLAIGTIALALVSMPNHQNTAGFITSAVLAVAAVAGWTFWDYFSKGIGWCYYVVLVWAGAKLIASIAYLTWPQVALRMEFGQERTGTILAGIISAIVLLILFLPTTRRHFKSVRESAHAELT